jgi:hypothetical protein
MLWLFAFIFLIFCQKSTCAAGLSEQDCVLSEIRTLSRHSCLKLTPDPHAFLPSGPHPSGASKWALRDLRFGVPEFDCPAAVSPLSAPKSASSPPIVGRGVTNYFKQRNREAACKFEYQYFPAPEQASITVYYYGGETTTFLRPAPSELVYHLNIAGSSVFHLRTQDAFNDIHQANQFSPAGHQLLADSMVTVVLFILDVQRRNPHIPIYYIGASFGGVKGLLLNALLTHRTSFKSAFQPPYDEVFRQAFRGIYQWPTLTGIICHAPAAERLWKDGILNKFNVSVRTLILHGFDDERVPLRESLKFIERSYADGTPSSFIQLHAIPQAAKSIKQSPESPHSSSLEGHFFPTHKPYNDEYWNAVDLFIREQGHLSMVGAKLSEERVRHARLAYEQFYEDSSQEARERSWLYRLYLLHLRSKSGFASRAQRFLECFKMLAYSKCNTDEAEFSVHLKTVIDTHGQWLINTIAQRHAIIFNAMLSSLLIKKLKDQPFPSLSMAKKEIRTGRTAEWLPLLMQGLDIEMSTLARICELVPAPVIRVTTLEGLSCLDLALENSRSTKQLIRTLRARGLAPSGRNFHNPLLA